jgi:hypothetical protein
MSSSSTCETKTSSNNNTNAVVVFTDLLGIVNHGYSLTWCKSIFAYLGPTAKDTLKLRSYCKLFSKALKPLPCWTSFPHPKYSTLNKLFGRFNEVSGSGSTNVPKVLLIDNGVHVIEDEDCGELMGEVNMVNINITSMKNQRKVNYSISIIGESREHCILMGGLSMNGKKEDYVNVSNLTLRESKACGVYGNGGYFHLDNVSVENSGFSGVYVQCTKRNSMKNCNVSHSKGSGLVVANSGLMTIDGKATTIHHNCTGGYTDRSGISRDYGLKTTDSSCSIHLASSLTIEMISKNNGGGGNHGGARCCGGGRIKTMRSKDTIMSCVDEQGRLRVTPGVNSLENAVYEAQQNDGITDIYLLNGEHDEKGGWVIIDYSVSIVGESREHCIVMGGLLMRGKEEDDVNVSNLTLRKSKGAGLYAGGASMHLDNVSVENSEENGVVVYGTKRNSMKNCNVSHSKWSGLLVMKGGLMTIDGKDTTIHDNGTSGGGDNYGLKAWDSSSSIHLVSPLTKEMISTNNDGGSSGGPGTIQTITNNKKEAKK